MIENRIGVRALDIFFPDYDRYAIPFRQKFSSVIGEEISAIDVVDMFFENESSESLHLCATFPKFILALGYSSEETSKALKYFNKVMLEI